MAVPTIPPVEPAGADEKTDAGAAAYATYVLETYWYAAARQDMKPILDLTNGRRCPTCKDSAKIFAATPESYEVPDRVPPVDKVTVYWKETRIWHVSVQYDLPDGTRYFTDGRDPESIDGEKNDVMEMDLRWTGRGWTLLQYRFPDDA